jgi:hypothetical protein
MQDLIRIFSERGDLAHLALFLWAACASAFALLALRELAASARRFDDFVRELARFNDTFDHSSRDLETNDGHPAQRHPQHQGRAEGAAPRSSHRISRVHQPARSHR